MRIRLWIGLLALLLCACAPNAAVSTPSPALATPMPTMALSPTPIPQTSQPTASAQPTALSGSAIEPSELDALAAAVRPARDQISLARSLGQCQSEPQGCPTVARTTPLELNVGEQQSFWVADFGNNGHRQVTAELRYIGPVVLMYVEQGLAFNQEDLEYAAEIFETKIYPRTREIFGSEIQPGVDGDTRLTILNATDPSGTVLGYYSAEDSLPRQINRFSNEREMFFMNAGALAFDNLSYLDVLAHEFQHMVHQNQQATSAVWFNEGSSQLAEDLNGFLGDGSTLNFLHNTDIQLTGWASGSQETSQHYGAAHLFLRYLYAQYANEAALLSLVQADAGDNLDAFVELATVKRPDIQDFAQLAADWAVANLLDNPAVADGRYTYNTGHDLDNLLATQVSPQTVGTGNINGSVAQFGSDYMAIPAGATQIEFSGSSDALLTSVLPRGRYSWWSGRSDNSLATLTQRFDLSNLTAATLQFDTWYELETHYDYAFVSVSTDDGQTWQTLPGTQSTTNDPQGLNYGNGYTGVSGSAEDSFDSSIRGEWITETVDLSAYAGQPILLRFWQINDQGFNAPGMLIDNIRIPELGYGDDVEADASAWQAEGFVRVTGALPQLWELRLIRESAAGAIVVEPVNVNAQGQVSTTFAADETVTLMIMASTPYTSERAQYQLTIR